MNPLGGGEGRGWRSGGAWKSWGGTYCESCGMRRSEKAKVLEKA